MASRFLRLFKYPSRVVLEVRKPEKKPSFNAKVGWTFVALVLYLIMLKTPVYGYADEGEDPFAALRIILASQRGTLAELGIGPIVTAGMILQLLVGSKIISVNFQDPEERALYTSTQKVLAVLMTFFEAIAYIAGGAYGEGVKNDPSAQVLIVIQLTIAGLCIMLMDELVQKGWGLGSGISLFIATSVSFQVFDGLFSIDQIADTGVDENGDPYVWRRGAILFFFQSIGRGEVLRYGLWHPGSQAADMFNVLATIVVFAVVIYFESAKIEIPVQHSEHRIPARYPIKLLYVSNIPVILVSALFANIFLVSRLMNQRFGGELSTMGNIARFLGVWEDVNGQSVPTGGLAAFTTAPRGVLQVAEDPFRAFIYMIIMTIMSAGFAMVWVETAGMSARDVSRQLLGAGMQIPGFRRHPKIVERYLNNYIPYAAFIGGVFIGLLASLADFAGAIGSGVGILLTTGIIRQYYEILAKERLADINPALAGLLGIT
ncbi:MAG: preprotein translocase subunit SecY [Candidatus Kariarchaeaceae archaeon]|jgi:preprotein translocase subunit SecY